MPPPKDLTSTTYFYRIINKVNGNDYVGITVDVPKRWRDHIWDSKKEPNKKESLIAKAIRKHGVENFKFEVVATLRSWPEGCYVEKTYRRFGGGKYNRTMGGEGVTGHRHSAESKAKMSAAKMGKPANFTPEHRAKLSEHGKSLKGIPKTEEHKANLSKAKTGVPLGPRPQEVKDKIARANTGKKHSPETREKLGALIRARNAKVKELGLRNLTELAEYERTHKTNETIK